MVTSNRVAVSAVLPLKESSRELIVEVAAALEAHLGEVTLQWRELLWQRYEFDERTTAALERLTLGAGTAWFRANDFSSFFESVNYYGTRLSKLQIDTRTVAKSLELYSELCDPYVQAAFGGRLAQANAALELLRSATFVSVSGAYFDTKSKESATLLSVLDAELAAGDLSTILSRVLEHTVRNFSGNLGMVLLKTEFGTLRVEALTGVEEAPGAPEELPSSAGFAAEIAQTGEPEMILNVGEDPRVQSSFIRGRASSLWGVPLKDREGVSVGVLIIGFSRPYEWLPTERELMRAIADRTALAVDRARINQALREREARIAELSAHLLQVQEEERKRISRELHDETGQALMVIRLYLGMLESTLTGRTAKNRVRETLAVVDRTIEGIRRIIARLSPLLLQELGLIAAIRKEAKDMAKTSGIRVEVTADDEIGRLAPEVETAVYRVLQEALHNVRKHAHAKNVFVTLGNCSGTLQLMVEDDGTGFTPSGAAKRAKSNSFGLAGIQERITSLGGAVKVSSAREKGTRLEITVPAGAPPGDFQQTA